MGLLQNITEGTHTVPSDNSHNNGLLNKASHLILKEDLFYLDLVQKYKLSNIIIFEINNRHYFSTKSFGFNASSIISSYSTVDFWNGIILSENKLYRFSKQDNTITPFYQFFSQNYIEVLNYLYIFKSSDCKLYITASNNLISNENNFESDLKIMELDFSKNISKKIALLTKNTEPNYSYFEIDFNDSINVLISNTIKNKFYLKYLYKNAIFSELTSRLYLYFKNFFVLPSNNYILKVAIPENIFFNLDINILKEHLHSNICDLFDDISFDFEINQLYDIKNFNEFIGLIN